MAWSGKMRVEGLIDRRLAMLGDVPVPPEAVMTFEGAEGSPDVTMRFEIRGGQYVPDADAASAQPGRSPGTVREGRPECVDISVRAKDDGRGIRSADVAMFNIDTLAIAVFEQLAMVDRPDDAAAVSVRRDITEARMRTRGQVTREELERVAQVYRSNVGRAPTKAVAATLGYSERTAARRIKAAEDVGLLPATTPGKRRA